MDLKRKLIFPVKDVGTSLHPRSMHWKLDVQRFFSPVNMANTEGPRYDRQAEEKDLQRLGKSSRKNFTVVVASSE